MTSLFSQRPTNNTGQQNGWLRLFLLFLLLCFWLFAWYMERINLSNVPLPALVSALIPFQLPPTVTFLRELFHWRVLRHFLPIIVGWWLAYEAAASLVMALYELPTKAGAKQLLGSLIRSQASAGTPLPLQNATLESVRERHVLLRVGGPGRVTVKRGDVAVTELNGRFHRILPAKTHNLHPFEYVHTVLNLQPQERSEPSISLITRDGIQFFADIHVLFQVKPGADVVTSSHEFPYDEEAVRTAAYAQTVLGKDNVMAWESLAIIKAKEILTTIIAGYLLDEILAHSSSAAEPLQVIQAELLRKTRAALRQKGIHLLSVHVGNLNLPEKVTEQYIQYWQSQSEAYINLSLADGKATALEEIEIARAEAEMTMIQAILEGVQRARYSSNTASMREVVALRMVEALEKMARQTQSMQGVSSELLLQISDIRHQLNAGDEPESKEEPAES